MREKHYISCWFPRQERDRYLCLLERIDCLDGWYEASPWFPQASPGFAYSFNVSDPRLRQLLTLLQIEKIEYLKRVDHIYTKSELTTFPLLDLGVSCKSIDGGGPEHGTEYDVSTGCPECGTGAAQVSPLMLPLAELPRKGLICHTHVGHVLVTKTLAEALQHAALSGLELRQARFYRNKEPLPWWQILSTYTMPRMSPKTKGLARETKPGWGCPVCQRDMYSGTMKEPLEIAYDHTQVVSAALPDVVQTWECFGRSVLHDDPERSLIRGFAQPLLLVNQKVFQVFRELKVKQVAFSPVRIE